MEQINFGTSMKNIAIGDKKEYEIKLIQSINRVMNIIRWRTHWALNPKIKGEAKETFGFNSAKPPPYVEELKELQERLCELVRNIQFRDQVRNHFQDGLRRDIKNLKKDDKVYMSADKTDNHYKVDPMVFEKMLENSITGDYRKAETNKFSDIESEAVIIADKLELADRIFRTKLKPANITLKDHKINFSNNPTCRLLNPTKTELGKISKQILSRVIKIIRIKTKFNQWPNTNAVIQWFNAISSDTKFCFLQFDIVAFYPSIKHNLLNKALTWASQFIPITSEEKDIIFHSKRSLLHFNICLIKFNAMK